MPYSATKLCDGAQMAIFGDLLCPGFPESLMQHISDMHSKFALRPHHMSKYGRSATAEIRRGKKEEEEEERRNHRIKIYVACPITQGGHKLEYWQLECGPMPNVMAALPNIGGALCSTPQSLADAHY